MATTPVVSALVLVTVVAPQRVVSCGGFGPGLGSLGILSYGANEIVVFLLAPILSDGCCCWCLCLFVGTLWGWIGLRHVSRCFYVATFGVFVGG